MTKEERKKFLKNLLEEGDKNEEMTEEEEDQYLKAGIAVWFNSSFQKVFQRRMSEVFYALTENLKDSNFKEAALQNAKFEELRFLYDGFKRMMVLEKEKKELEEEAEKEPKENYSSSPDENTEFDQVN